MKGLYESILSDIEDQLDFGDEKVPELVANMENSELREFFHIAAGDTKPFEFSDKGKTLTVNPLSYSRFLHVNDTRLNDIVSIPIETLICKSSFCYECPDVSKNICPCIKADSFVFNDFAARTFSDMEIYAGNYSGDRIFPNISFRTGKASAEITNSKLEIDYSVTRAALLQFNGDIPIFKNVKSDSIRKIEITDRREIKFSDPKLNVTANIFGNKRWGDLFEFGYDLEINTGASWNTMKIKSMKDFRKIVASRNYWNTKFNEFPYRLKNGVKLSDFIDISEFKNLQVIQIFDNKMNVLFINNAYGNIREFKEFIGHISASLKQNIVINEKEKLNFPVTSDGWTVIITQV